MSALESKSNPESNYDVLYVVIDGNKFRINKYFQTALYFTNYSSMLNTNTIPIVMFKREFHILNSSYIEVHRYNIYLRIRLNKAMDYFGDQRALNLYSGTDIEFDNLKLNSVLNLRAYHIDKQYTKLYIAYIKYIKDIIRRGIRDNYIDKKTLNAIYKSAKLHNDIDIITVMQDIRSSYS